MNKPPPTRPQKPSEEGYILVAVMFMLAILVIAMTIAAPKIAKAIQRDRELETMHRGKQYIRAIKLYYKKFNAYPPNVDALVNTNQIRFLRKKYIDPTTGKDEWKVIHLGQNKVPTAYGFFGVPIGGPGMGGGLCGNALSNSTGSSSSSIGGTSSSNSFGSNSSSGSSSSSFGSSSSSFGSSSPTAGCPPTSTSGSAPAGTVASTDPNAPSGTTDPSAANGSTTSGSQSATGSSGTGSGTDTGLTGQTFGGGAIMGVSPGSPKQSILVYKKKNHYNEWEFVYDPLAEQMMQQGGLAGGGSNGLTPGGTPGSTPFGGGSTPIGGGSMPIGGGSTPGGSGFGNSGGTPSPTQPQQPQQ